MLLLSVPDDRARPRRRDRPGAGAGRSGRVARARLGLARRDRPASRRRARSSSTSGSRPASAAAIARRDLLRAATARRARRDRLARGRGDRAGRARPTWSRSASTAFGSPARHPETALEAVVFAAGAADVEPRDLRRSRDRPRRRPRRRSTSPPSCASRSRRCSSMSGDRSIDRIGLLVTNDPARGEGPLGIVRDAALVIEDGAVAAIEPAGRRGRRALRRRRALRDPRLRRQPHPPDLRRRPRRGVRGADGRGSRTRRAGSAVTTEATRAASDDELRAPRPRPPRRGARRRDHPPGDQVRLRAHGRVRGAPLPARRRAHRRRHLPRRPPGAARVRGPRRRLRRAGLRRDARRLRARTAAGSTSSASAAPSTPSSRARCSRPGATPAWACACTATSSARAPVSRLAVEVGAASVDHCTYLDDADIEALAGSRHRRDLPAGDRLLHPPALSGRPPRDRRRRRRSRSRPTPTRARATRPRCRSASRSRCARWG